MQCVAATSIVGIALFSTTLKESCDKIELNHFFDKCENLVFRQIILWDWHEQHQRYEARAWTMYENVLSLTHHNGKCVVRYRDAGVSREIISSHFCESFTQVDPERENLKIVPHNERRALIHDLPQRQPTLEVVP